MVLCVGRVSNRSCAFPFAFRGQQRSDCVWVNDMEACKVSEGEGRRG